MKKPKRNRLIVNVARSKQFRYALMNVAVVLVIVMLVSMTAMYKVFSSTQCDSDNVLVGLDSLGSVLGPIRHVWVVAGFAIFFSVALCFVYVLFLTRKFLGPEVAILRQIDAMIDGNYDLRIKLRDKDELYEIASRLNALSEKLKSRDAKS